MPFIGDEWAEDHHDVELMDGSGRRVARARLPEGVAGMARLHAMLAEHLDQAPGPGADQVLIGIEADRGHELSPENATIHRDHPTAEHAVIGKVPHV